MADGGYSAKNGARTAPVHRTHGEGIQIGEDMPLLCETCLGQNPYVRMVKLRYGEKLCKISNVPYQAFRWKAGPNGRYKETIISYAVAADRNICQTCLNDMKYGLPVGMRDHLLADQEANSTALTIPTSEVGLQYYYQNQAQMVASGLDHESTQNQSFAQNVSNLPAMRQLQQFSHTLHKNNHVTTTDNTSNNTTTMTSYSNNNTVFRPPPPPLPPSNNKNDTSNTSNTANKYAKTAFRNLPKLCSFWLNGVCTRVVKKTCPFRPCCGAHVFPEIAGSHPILHKELIAELNTLGPAVVQKQIKEEYRQAFTQALKGNKDEAIRKRVNGEDDLTQKYLNKMKEMNMSLEPPADVTNTTLWLGNIEDYITEKDIHDAMYAYGYIQHIHIVRTGKCAFVEYATREMTEYAAKQLYRALIIKGQSININWSKPKSLQTEETVKDTVVAADGSTALTMLAPPGMEKAPVSAYSLPTPSGKHEPVLVPLPVTATTLLASSQSVPTLESAETLENTTSSPDVSVSNNNTVTDDDRDNIDASTTTATATAIVNATEDTAEGEEGLQQLSSFNEIAESTTNNTTNPPKRRKVQENNSIPTIVAPVAKVVYTSTNPNRLGSTY